MVTLHILQLIADNGCGTINESLFWEKMPPNTTGLAIISRGAPQEYRQKCRQSFDLIVRGKDDLLGSDLLERVTQLLDAIPYDCQLPFTQKSQKKYTKVHFEPDTAIENLGEDETGRLIWRSTYTAYYTKG